MWLKQSRVIILLYILFIQVQNKIRATSSIYLFIGNMYYHWEEKGYQGWTFRVQTKYNFLLKKIMDVKNL